MADQKRISNPIFRNILCDALFVILVLTGHFNAISIFILDWGPSLQLFYATRSKFETIDSTASSKNSHSNQMQRCKANSKLDSVLH